MKISIILVGGGGHCRSCIDVIEATDFYKISGILDVQERVGEMLLGYPIIGTDMDMERLADEGHLFLITLGQVGTSEGRKRLYARLQKLNAGLATVISPRAYVSVHASVEEGSIVMHDAVVNASARIGRNCIINTRALVEHDAEVADHCHLATGAIVNGGARVETGSFIGSNAVVRENALTGAGAFVKAGSVCKGVSRG